MQQVLLSDRPMWGDQDCERCDRVRWSSARAGGSETRSDWRADHRAGFVSWSRRCGSLWTETGIRRSYPQSATAVSDPTASLSAWTFARTPARPKG